MSFTYDDKTGLVWAFNWATDVDAGSLPPVDGHFGIENRKIARGVKVILDITINHEDSSAHLAEHIQRASVTVTRVIMGDATYLGKTFDVVMPHTCSGTGQITTPPAPKDWSSNSRRVVRMGIPDYR